jgi:AMP deaminase
MYNKEREIIEQKVNSLKDFYSVNKIDTHVHHSACMSQKQILEFIREKFRSDGDVIVAKNKEGKEFTLS